MGKNVEIQRFISYIFFAGIGTLADISILFILTEFMGIYYFLSSIVSYTCGGVLHYFLNKRYTFKNKSKKILKQMSLFFFISFIGLFLNQLILYLLVEFVGLWYMAAKFVSIFIVLIWNFTGHKYITFRIIR